MYFHKCDRNYSPIIIWAIGQNQTLPIWANSATLVGCVSWKTLILRNNIKTDALYRLQAAI
ncbi:hypothetical protein, partial [Microcoleus anatoxicus]